ncbi:unnamed protein product, partial [marine sediment metagenome]
REAAAEYDVEQHIRYQHKVVAANWSSADKRWLVTAERGDAGEQVTISCKFLFNCSGYYDYEKGYTPEFAGIDAFNGEVIHAQHWPEDLDYQGKRVVVIGSGATAVTLVPAMSKDTGSLVMLQRTPTYIASLPLEDPMAKKLRKWLPNSWAFRLTRWKKVLFQIYIYQLSRRKPQELKKYLLGEVSKALGPDYDVAEVGVAIRVGQGTVRAGRRQCREGDDLLTRRDYRIGVPIMLLCLLAPLRFCIVAGAGGSQCDGGNYCSAKNGCSAKNH